MGCGTSFPSIPKDSNLAPTVEKPHIREQNDSESFNADCLDGAVHSSHTTELVKGTSDIQLIQSPEAPGLPHTTNPSDQTPSLSSTMSSDIPAINEDCLQLAQQLVTKYPRLKSGFDDINSFIHALEEDPMLDTKGEQIRMLAHKTIGLSYVNKDESHRRLFAEYLSYTRAADVMYKTYSSYLKARKLEFLTEKVSRAQLTEEGSYQFVRELRGLLWNYTDASVQFSERVCGSGLLRYFVGDLKAILDEAGDPAKVSTEHLTLQTNIKLVQNLTVNIYQTDRIKKCIQAEHNCSKAVEKQTVVKL